MGAGRQGSGIIISGGASLSVTGEPAQRPVWSAFLVGLLAYVLEIGLITPDTTVGPITNPERRNHCPASNLAATKALPYLARKIWA